MTRNLLTLAPAIALLAYGQTQIDNTKQIRNRTPDLLATDFPGSDVGEKVNNAFASFGSNSCGTVAIPAGTYTFATTIYVPGSCILEGAGRGNDHGPYGTKLLYNGPAATAAIIIMDPDMSPAYFSAVRDLAVHTNAAECPSNGMLEWNAAAGGANKWQCYDGTTFTTPFPHLAGILHGQIDPNTLLDGTHITITNVDVNGGGQDGDINQQGGFHFGVWLNGCEECILEGVYAFQADDGFFVGEASHGVLFNQITARINRRSGFHYRGSNASLCSMCLFESNQWWGNPGADITKYGAGIRISQASTGEGRDLKFRATYFENNRVDIFAADNIRGSIDIEAVSGGGDIRGKFFASRFAGCEIADASLITARGQDIILACRITTGTPNTEVDGSGNLPRIIIMDVLGTQLQQVIAPTESGAYATVYQGPVRGDESVYLRNAGGSSEGLHLEGNTAATAGAAHDSPLLKFRSSKWSGSSAQYNWFLRAAARTSGGPETASSLHVMFGSSDPTASGQFAFREGGVFRLTSLEAKQSSPTTAVSSNAGTGASCARDVAYGVSDVSGQLTLTTGTSLWAAGTQCAITLAGPFSGWVTLTPANLAASAAMSARQVYVERGVNQFTVSFGVADTSQKTYQFNWHAIGNY